MIPAGTFASGRDVVSQRQVTGKVIEYRDTRGITGGLYVLDVSDDPSYAYDTAVAECVRAAR